jgi:hypothetical protein
MIALLVFALVAFGGACLFRWALDDYFSLVMRPVGRHPPITPTQ